MKCYWLLRTEKVEDTALDARSTTCGDCANKPALYVFWQDVQGVQGTVEIGLFCDPCFQLKEQNGFFNQQIPADQIDQDKI